MTLNTELSCKKVESSILMENKSIEAFSRLERSVYTALETYSNVHRGSGHFSKVTTELYEEARKIVLIYLGLGKIKYTVIFSSPRTAEILTARLKPKSYHILSSKDTGLPLGVRALAVRKRVLNKVAPVHTGGGTARLVAPGWVVWAKAPGKFEAGTPAIINVIAFAKALILIRKYGNDIFLNTAIKDFSAKEILYEDELAKYSGHELLKKLRQILIGRNFPVPTMAGTSPYINLDNSASTPTFEPVWNLVRQTWRLPVKTCQELAMETRHICSEMLGASAENYELIFTANTTEAINLVAENYRNENNGSEEPVVLSTVLEHTSNDLPWRQGPRCTMIRLPVDHEGFINPQLLETILDEYNGKKLYARKRIRMVAITGASNVLGTFNDLEEVSRIVHHYGAQLLVDGAQMVAHRKVGIERSGIDFFAYSAHKVYAPFGSGMLIARKGLLNFSETEMETIRASGEENTAGIAALGKSVLLLQRIGMNVIQDEEKELTTYTLQGLVKIPGLKIHGVRNPESPGIDRKAGVISFNFDKTMSNTVARELALRGGIGIRYGCHCAHILVKHILGVGAKLEKFQHVIAGIVRKVKFPGVARVSFGLQNTREEVDILIKILEKIEQKPPVDHKDSLVLSKAAVQKQLNDFVRERIEKVFYTDTV